MARFLFTLQLILSTIHMSVISENIGEKYLEKVRPHYEEMKSAKLLGSYGHIHQLNQSMCSIPMALRLEISSYEAVLEILARKVLLGSFKGSVYNHLSTFLRAFGPRPSGSDSLENAIKYLEKEMEKMNLASRISQAVPIPIWKRGVERATVFSPVNMPIEILGFGQTVATPETGINGEIILIKSLLALEQLKNKIKGKIVLFSSSDGDDAIHTFIGPSRAAGFGAMGVLCKSPYKSIYTIGALYDENGPKIPVAMVGREDATKIENLLHTGSQVSVNMVILRGDYAENVRVSRNIQGDWPGREHGNESVLIMSHSDTWDRGVGAHDNGIGIFLGIETIALFQELGLRPRRTVRNAVFTAEEVGIYGAGAWTAKYKDQLASYSAVIEADQGCLGATGLIVSGSHEASCVVYEIGKLVERVIRTFTRIEDLVITKIEVTPTNMLSFYEQGVPGIGINGDVGGEYYEIHHNRYDSIESMKPEQLDKCLILMAGTTFVLAELKDKLPRSKFANR